MAKAFPRYDVIVDQVDIWKPIHTIIQRAGLGEITNARMVVVVDSTGDSTVNDMIANQTALLAKLNVTLVDAGRSGMDFKEWYNNEASPTIDETATLLGDTGVNTMFLLRPGLNGHTRLAGDMVALEAEHETGIDTLQARFPDGHPILSVPILTGNTQRNIDLNAMFSRLAQKYNLPLINTHDAMAMVYDPPGTGNLRFYYDSTHQTPVGGLRTIISEANQYIPASMYNKAVIDENYRAGSIEQGENLAKAAVVGLWSNGDGSHNPNPAWRKLPRIAVVEGATYTHTRSVTGVDDRTDVQFMNINDDTLVLDTDVVAGQVVAPAGAFWMKITLSNDGTAYDALGNVNTVTSDAPDNYIETIDEMLVGLNNIGLAIIPGATSAITPQVAEHLTVDFIADRPDPTTTTLKTVHVRFETVASDGTEGDYFLVPDGLGSFLWEQG